MKVLPAHFAQDPIFEQRFRREAHAAARIHNPHIVPIHDYGEIDGRLFVDMALIDGHDLATEIAKAPLDPTRAVTIIEQIARALNSAHKAGLVHRDVKPSNILLDADGQDGYAYLIDFGIARAAADTGLTGTGATIGTWAYMAPERFTTDQTDPRSDVYALACVLYESLTGTKPYPGDSLERLFAGHLTSPPPRPSVTRPDIPAGLDTVIADGLAKKPEHRYQTVTALAAAAREALQATAVRPRPVSPPAPPTVEAGATHPHPARPSRVVVARSAPYQAGQATQPRPPSPRYERVQPPLTNKRRKRGPLLVAALAVIAVVTAATIAIVNFSSDRISTTTIGGAAYGDQTTLPVTGLKFPNGVSIGTSGTIYISDAAKDDVLEFAENGDSQTTLPLIALLNPQAVAVDKAGVVYVSDSSQVFRLEAGTPPVTLPFSGLNLTGGVAVDSTGGVYVTDNPNSRVLKLARGDTTPTELPIAGLDRPGGVAVDSSDNVYVVSSNNNRVLELAANTAATTELPFAGLNRPWGIAADKDGAIYITDTGNKRVLKLAAGASDSAALPITGLATPRGVAVDATGSVYVTDYDDVGGAVGLTKSQIVKLPLA